jgi:tetratricopeptide (TPR) repeat protein
LVLCVEKSNQMRYRLLETIREYARERLDEAGERETVCRRHLDFYLAFTEEAKAGLASPQEAASWELMETEYANVLAALDWSYSGDSHLDACVTLFGILADFWERRGRPSEGNKWLAGVLARSEKSSASGRAEALYGAGILTSNDDPAEAERLLKESLAIRRDLGETRTMPATLVWLGDLARMRGDDVAAWTYYEELLTICQAMGNRKGVAGAMANLGNEALSSGDYEKARYYLEESLRLRRELNYSIGIAWSANSLGEWARCLGDYARAAPLYDEALRLFRETGVKKGVGWALQNLGHVAQHERDYARAETLFRESLLDFHEYPLGIASSLAGLAGVAGALGQPLRAGCLFGAMEAILERIESRLDRADLLACERNLAETRAQADPPAFAAAWAEGRALSLEQAVAFALAT